MINYLENPYDCVFSKNPVNFKIFASDFSAESPVFPTMVLSFVFQVQHGKFFEFSFINPVTKIKERTVFVAKNGALKNGKEIPGSSYPNDNANYNYVEEVAEFMRSNKTLSSNYTIAANLTNITITAKQGIEELILTDFSNNHSAFGFNPVTATKTDTFWKAKKRVGHRININVYFEKEYMSNVFELVSQQNDTVNEEGIQDIEIASILDSEIKNSFINPPLPDITDPTATNVTQKGKVLRRYFVEVSEQWQGMKTPIKWIKSKNFHVHFGGVSMDDFSRDNPLHYMKAQQSALTWWRDKKRLYPQQKDWLSYMNLTMIDGAYIIAKLRLLYKDGTDDYFNLGGQQLNIWETITVPVGFEELNIPLKQDAAKEVYGWQVSFDIFKGGELAKRTYLYNQLQNFKTNTIVYLNSFGVAESFVCTGFFENNLVTSSDVASKTLRHDYKSINGRDFVFNKNSKNTFKARSGVLNKAEVVALKSMLNVAPVFLVEKTLLRPIIIDTGSFVIDDESEITQTLDFKITKSLELTNVSEMITKPVLKITEDCGVFKGEVISEEKIVTYSDLTIFNLITGLFEDVPFTGIYQATNKAEIEGFYNFSCSVTIGFTTYELTASYHFKREEAFFDSPNHNGSGDLSQFEFKTSVSEEVWLENQSNSKFSVVAPADTMTTIGGAVNKGVKTHRISSSCLTNMYHFKIANQDYTNIEVGAMKNLRQLGIFSCAVNGHFSTAKWHTLETIHIMNSNMDSFELGMNLDLSTLSVEDNVMDAEAMETLVKEIYTYRKLFKKVLAPFVLIYFQGNTAPNANTLAMSNGTGIYAGDGLVDYDIIVTY